MPEPERRPTPLRHPPVGNKAGTEERDRRRDDFPGRAARKTCDWLVEAPRPGDPTAGTAALSYSYPSGWESLWLDRLLRSSRLRAGAGGPPWNASAFL